MFRYNEVGKMLLQMINNPDKFLNYFDALKSDFRLITKN